MCSMAGTFVPGHMSVMWNVCMLVLLVTLLIQWVHARYLYWNSCLICEHELICICGLYVTFERHICCWSIHGKKCEVHIAVGCVLAYVCKNIGFICPCSIMAVKPIFVLWPLFVQWHQIYVQWHGSRDLVYMHVYVYSHMHRYINSCIAGYIHT